MIAHWLDMLAVWWLLRRGYDSPDDLRRRTYWQRRGL